VSFTALDALTTEPNMTSSYSPANAAGRQASNDNRQTNRWLFRNQTRRGAAAIEFALVAPVFLLLIAGIIEFGQAFRIQHTLTTASRRGARALIVDSAEIGQVSQDISKFCDRALGDGDVTIDIAVNGSTGADPNQAEEGDEISVTVSVPYSRVGIAFFAELLSVSTLSATSTLEHE
jgi:Flp pilus assembly protein TadG